jgi:GntR family transcriptional regulator
MTGWTGTRVQPRTGLADQVVKDLRQAIRDGAFGVNGQLPSEPALSQQLGVSRPTVRQAISVLEQEGMLVRRHGLGTFVMSDVVGLSNILNANGGIGDMIRSAGMVPGTKRTLVRTATASQRDASKLNIDVGAVVAVVERTRTADGRPVALTRDFVRVDERAMHGIQVDDLVRLLDSEASLYGRLRESGVDITYGVARVLPARATKVLADQLEVNRGSDLLLLEQTDYTSAGVPILFSEEYLVPDALAVYVFRRGPD